MSVKVTVSPEARRDLLNIQTYICDDLCNPLASERIIGALKQAIEKLKIFPKMGRTFDDYLPIHTDFRLLICGNYRIFYLTDEETAEVIRVLHVRQDYLAALFDEDEETT